MTNKSLKAISIVLGIMAILYVLLEACYCYNNIQAAHNLEFKNCAISEPAVITMLHIFGFAWCLLLIIWFIMASGEAKRKTFGVLAVIALSIFILAKAGDLVNQHYLRTEASNPQITYYSIVGAFKGIGNLMLGIAFIIMGRHLPEKTRKWSISIGICILVILVLRILHPMIDSFINSHNSPQDHMRTNYLMNASTNILTIVKYVFMAVFFFLCSKRVQHDETEEVDIVQ